MSHQQNEAFRIGSPQHHQLLLIAQIERRAREIAEVHYRLVMEQLLADPAVIQEELSTTSRPPEQRYPVFKNRQALEKHQAAVDILSLIVQGARKHIHTEINRLIQDPDVSWSSSPDPGALLSAFTSVS